MTADQDMAHARGIVAATARWGDRWGVAEQARRALDLARTEARIRRAVDEAPPLDEATVQKLRDLIRPTVDEAETSQ